MCLYPRLIKNKKYTATLKNNGIIPEATDKRVLAVPIKCGRCMECRKAIGREWQTRLNEEVRTDNKGRFVTLTFSDESIAELGAEIEVTGYERDNAIATLGVRRFLERWRKHKGKSIKHWLITELGHNGTENVHLHGIVWSTNNNEIKERWQYGYVFCGGWLSEQTVNYIVKYVHKTDIKHQNYKAKVLTSKGIGSGYISRFDAERNQYKGNNTKETYTTRAGLKLGLPIYYRNKIYSEEEREKLWLQKLDKMERFVDKKRVDISKGLDEYYALLKEAQAKSVRLGYGSDETDWEKKKYEDSRRDLLYEKRLKKGVKPKKIFEYIYVTEEGEIIEDQKVKIGAYIKVQSIIINTINNEVRNTSTITKRITVRAIDGD